MPDLRIAPVASEAAWEAAQAIRRQVFIEEQECPPAEEFDAHDATSRHLLGYVAGEPVAVARWRAVRRSGEGSAAKLERFAVRPAFRGRGYGRALVCHTIQEAMKAGFATQVIHAQAHLEDFYATFGFERRGTPFCEAGTPHLKMVRAA